MFASDILYIRYGFMIIRFVIAVVVMLVFGPVFTLVVVAMIPGKEGMPFPPVKTRWPLSPEDTTSSKDISLWGLNLWR